MVRLEMAACIWLSGNCSSPVITHPFIHLYSHYHQHTSINYFSYKLLSCWSFPATTFSLPPYNLLERITFTSHPFSQWLHNCTSTNATHVLLSRSPVTSNLLVKSASTVFFFGNVSDISDCHSVREEGITDSGRLASHIPQQTYATWLPCPPCSSPNIPSTQLYYWDWKEENSEWFTLVRQLQSQEDEGWGWNINTCQWVRTDLEIHQDVVEIEPKYKVIQLLQKFQIHA